MSCNICGEQYQGWAGDCKCTNFNPPLLDIILCSIGFHTWSMSSEEGVEWCSRFCQKRRCRDGCMFTDYETVHQDDVTTLERCTKCGREVKNGL